MNMSKLKTRIVHQGIVVEISSSGDAIIRNIDDGRMSHFHITPDMMHRTGIRETSQVTYIKLRGNRKVAETVWFGGIQL